MEPVTYELKPGFVDSSFVDYRSLSKLHDEVCAPPPKRARRQRKTAHTLQVLGRRSVVESTHERMHLVDFEIEARVAVVINARRYKRLVHCHRFQCHGIESRRVDN